MSIFTILIMYICIYIVITSTTCARLYKTMFIYFSFWTLSVLPYCFIDGKTLVFELNNTAEDVTNSINVWSKSCSASCQYMCVNNIGVAEPIPICRWITLGRNRIEDVPTCEHWQRTRHCLIWAGFADELHAIPRAKTGRIIPRRTLNLNHKQIEKKAMHGALN